MVTHERDMLKKDVKRIAQARDGAFKHLSMTSSPVPAITDMFGYHHHRTASDTASPSKGIKL